MYSVLAMPDDSPRKLEVGFEAGSSDTIFTTERREQTLGVATGDTCRTAGMKDVRRGRPDTATGRDFCSDGAVAAKRNAHIASASRMDGWLVGWMSQQQ